MHAPGMHSQVGGDAEQVQVSVPRQRLLQVGSELRGTDAASAGACKDFPRPVRRADRRRQGEAVSPGAGGVGGSGVVYKAVVAESRGREVAKYRETSRPRDLETRT